MPKARSKTRRGEVRERREREEREIEDQERQEREREEVEETQTHVVAETQVEIEEEEREGEDKPRREGEDEDEEEEGDVRGRSQTYSFSAANEERLVEFFSMHPCFYDKTLPTYTNATHKRKLIQSMAAELNSTSEHSIDILLNMLNIFRGGGVEIY